MASTKTERNSSIELLRITSMFFIVLGHYIGNGLNIYELHPIMKLCNISILSFCIIGVNCFVIISGRFLIKDPLKSSVRIFLEALFYSLLFFFLLSEHVGKLDVKHFLKAFFCVSHGGLWFVSCYVQLCLLSPVLNRALKNAPPKLLIWYVIFLTFLNEYFGFFLHGSINPNGFNIMHFIYLYVIGYTIGKFNIPIKIQTAIIGYIILSIIIACFAIILFKYETNLYQKYAFNYNNPLILISSILCFIAFSKHTFVNRKLNFISKGCFAVYLIQGNPYLKEYIYGCIGTLPSYFNGFCLYGIIVLFAAMTVFLFCMIDIGRRAIFARLKLDKILNKVNFKYE